ncbi:AAA family ATPase [Parapedobacter sp. 2B3]|uniref:tetratricopeptide repeat protein n=1 Tax=Parapedobacter sp. 2B3 TaxID=3342381 RepID=UPI0035B656E7
MMMKIDSNHVKAIGGLLLSGGANILLASGTGGLSLPFSPLVAKLCESISANIASNHIAKLGNHGFDHLLKRINNKGTDPDKINHDLENLFKKSSIAALEYIRSSYLKGFGDEENFFRVIKSKFTPRKDNERQKLLKQIDRFFDANIEQIRKEIIEGGAIDINKEDVKHPEKFLGAIVDIFFSQADTALDAATIESLRSFFTAHLPYCFELAFKESLKHHEVGFKAFQIWILEDLRAQNADNAAALQEIAQAIGELKNGGSFLDKKKQEKEWQRWTDEVYAIAESNLQGIKAVFSEITSQMHSRFDAIDHKLNEIHSSIHVLNTGISGIDSRLADLVDKLDVLHENKPVVHKLSSPPKPEVFIGREHDLNNIRAFFDQHRAAILLISGFGGMGKSSIASQYFHSFHSAYSHVMWAVGKSHFKEALLAHADMLHLPIAGNLPDEVKLRALVSKLENLARPCLLVMDNIDRIDDLKQVRALLGRLSNFHILITTRIKEFETMHVYHLPELTKEKGLELFKCHYPFHLPEDDELFFDIFRLAHGNTKIIELLSKRLHIENRDEEVYPLSKLLENLRQKGVLGLGSQTVVESDVEGTVEDIIMAMYEISDLSNRQTEILHVFSILPAESIPYPVLKQLLVHLGDFGEDINYLYKSGWLEKQRENRMALYKMSPLIQDIVKKKKGLSLGAETLSLIRSAANVAPTTQFNYYLSIHENLKSVFESTNVAELTDEAKEILALFFYAMGEHHPNTTEREKYTAISLGYFEHMRTIKELNNYLEKKRAYRNDDKDKAYLKTYEDELTTEEKTTILNYYHMPLQLMANIKLDLEDLTGCEHYFGTAYRIMQLFTSTLSSDPPPYVWFDYFSYNRYFAKIGREREAEAFFFNMYKQLKSKLFSILDENEAKNPRIKNSSGVYHFSELAAAELEQAELNLQYTSIAAHELAKLFRKQERFEEAVYFHNRAVSLLHLREDVNHENVAVCIMNLAATYLLMSGSEHIPAADELLVKVYEYYKANHNEEQSSFGYYYAHKVTFAINKGEGVGTWLGYYHKAVAIFTQHFGEAYSLISDLDVKCYDHLKGLPSEQKLRAEFGQKIIRAFVDHLDTTINKFGMHHPSLLRGMMLAYELLIQQDRLDEAETLINKRSECLRLRSLRTEVRTFGLPVREINDAAEKERIVKLLKPVTSLPTALSEFDISIIELPFYKTYDLCKIKIRSSQSNVYKHVLISEHSAIFLGTDNTVIYDLGETDLQLDRHSAINYALFFFDNAVGRHGKFYLLNDAKEIPWREDIQPAERALFEKLKNNLVIPPLKLLSADDEKIVLQCHLVFRNTLFKSNIIIDLHNGIVQLTDSDQLFIDASEEPCVLVEAEASDSYLNLNPNRVLIDQIQARIDPG